MIIVDTNVISEATRRVPSETVHRWFGFQRLDELHTTAISEAEIQFGIETMPPGKRRTELEAMTGRIFSRIFAGRVLPFDSKAARAYAFLAADRQRRGKRMSFEDAQIAAIARAHGAALATRNIDHFKDCGIAVINPWTA